MRRTANREPGTENRKLTTPESLPHASVTIRGDPRALAHYVPERSRELSDSASIHVLNGNVHTAEDMEETYANRTDLGRGRRDRSRAN